MDFQHVNWNWSIGTDDTVEGKLLRDEVGGQMMANGWYGIRS
jgi:hypothetical protein